MPRMPSRLWYLAAVGVLVLGIAGAAYVLIARLGGLEDALTRFLVPAETTLTFNEPGTYTIFHEETGMLDGVVYSGSDISGLRVTVESVATGEPVDVEGLSANVSYSFAGSSAVGIMAFTIDAPGDYLLSAAYGGDRTEPSAILTVAQGFMAKLLAAIFMTLGIGFGATILAIVIALVTFVRRRRVRREAASGATPA